jgi:hypothetical protein
VPVKPVRNRGTRDAGSRRENGAFVMPDARQIAVRAAFADH